jgi:predicted nucleic-acid-binding protein
MIALDTNILVRLVLQDDEKQSRTAERILIQARRNAEQVFIADIVLCELVWVLARRARATRNEISAVLERLLRTELMVFQDSSAIERAIIGYRRGRGDFADYLIRESAASMESTEIVTFDSALKGEALFRIVS